MIDVIQDGDHGVDDALATLLLAAHPDVRIAAVGSVHGNTGAESAAANAIQVLDVAGLTAVPVAVGARRPLAQPVHLSTLVHGEDGLGGAAQTPDRRPVDASAAEQLVRLARAEPGRYTLVATGPLTNVALALLLEPALPRLLDRIVVMGGALDVPGNITPVAEANIAHDPEAADLVLTCGADVTLVPLDTTMATWLGRTELARIAAASDPRARFATRILAHYLDFYAAHGRDGCPLHDESAAALTVSPGLGRYVEVPLRVELRGADTRGMLVADRRVGATPDTPPVRVATGADRDGVVDLLLAGLLDRDAPCG
ncbi:nucleoside hydrolase [Actinocatenispora rupis]|uniref:Nucleoside hydrolase n=1 Tax=Actinocatenispora rupis TaxID=519421 RepID=A0A8J3J9S7_9ACTN|nr:nucleoside hydrolase [Actinocatenispora rupis]GID14470.1 nucleoside hydrolase [Actinocatenispora rupis]